MEIKLEETAFCCQATIKKNKLNTTINTMNINKLNEIESNIQNAKRLIANKEEKVAINAEANGTNGDHESMNEAKHLLDCSIQLLIAMLNQSFYSNSLFYHSRD